MLNDHKSNHESAPPPDFALVNEQQEKLASFQILEASVYPFNTTSKVDSHSLVYFNQLFNSVPHVSSKLAANSKQLVVCDIPLDKLIKAKDGRGSIGITTKPDSTQFSEHVRLNKPENIRNIVNTGLVMNLVSNLVAQQHLAEINKKLQNIQNGVNEILEFQKNERTSHLQAFCERIQSCVQTLSMGERINPSTLQSISMFRDNIRPKTLHLEADFEKKLSEFKSFDSTSHFGSNDIRSELQQSMKTLERLYQEYMLGMQCLVMANLLLYFQENFSEEFIRDAQTLVAKLDVANGIQKNWKEIQLQVAFHIDKMHPWFELERSTQANALMLRKSIERVTRILQKDISAVTDIHSKLTNQKPQQIVLEVKGGQVVGGSYLS